MLTLDSATEFLFGHSTDVLEPGTTTAQAGYKFGESFSYATEKIGLKARVGKLSVLFPDKKFDDSVSFVHTYIKNYGT